MSDLAVIAAADLREGDRCTQRLRRRIDGARGGWMGNARWSVGSRVTEDARLAHSEMRAPTASDFPDPSDLVPEQVATYRAAASGYLAMFGDERAECVDIAKRRSFDAQGVAFAAGLGLTLSTDREPLEIRKLSVTGRPPSIDQEARLAIALVVADQTPHTVIRVVHADLVSLELDAEHLDLGALIDEAESWFTGALVATRARVVDPRPKTGDECTYCEYIWDCAAHRSARI